MMERPAVDAVRTHVVIDSPIGPLTLVGADGALSGLYMDAHRHLPEPTRFGPVDDGRNGDLFEACASQLAEYFDERRTAFDLPLAMVGTEFQRRVWSALQEIPYGHTESYGELALRIGSPGASRAVGLANGRNPVSIVVPCHRVIGAGGSLTGYGGGLERKRQLLDLERRVAGLSLV